MKKIKIVLLSLVAIVVIVAVCTQIIFPVKVSASKVECVSWDATFEAIKAQAQQYNSGQLDDTIFAYSFNGELPSNNPDDYMNIYCYFDTVNISMIDKYSINATLKKSDSFTDNILFVSNANTTYLSGVDRNDTTSAYIILDVYIGNLDKEKIEQLVRGLDITVKAYGDYFGTREKVVSYKNCENITIEFAE